MNNQIILIKSLQQKDNHTFTIEWSDQQVNDYRLSYLQQNCPCANCVNQTAESLHNKQINLNEDVRATRIVNAGSYALKVYFTSGCSAGIYGFDLLRRLSQKTHEQS